MRRKKYRWPLIRGAFLSIRIYCSIVSLAGTLILGFGYGMGQDILYRPIHNGPATHPLTALSVFLLGATLCLINTKINRKHSISVFLLPFAVLIISGLRIFDIVYSSNLSLVITPFQNILQQEYSRGLSNAMGLNTAIALLGTAISLQAVLLFRKPLVSQFFAFAALFLPMVSFTGHIYRLEEFYGQMSIVSTFLLFFIALATLSLTANHGALRAVLSPYPAGRVARIQIVVGYIVPVIAGFLLLQKLSTENGNEATGMMVIFLVWFIIFLSSSSAMILEGVDRKRRVAERYLIEAAMTDPLTGLFNRRSFFDFSQKNLKEARIKEVNAWVLMIDIDHFKSINDMAGHGMGDEVLKYVSSLIRESVRKGDIVGRCQSGCRIDSSQR